MDSLLGSSESKG